MTIIKILYLQFYILLRAHIDSADAVLYCVVLFFTHACFVAVWDGASAV